VWHTPCCFYVYFEGFLLSQQKNPRALCRGGSSPNFICSRVHMEIFIFYETGKKPRNKKRVVFTLGEVPVLVCSLEDHVQWWCFIWTPPPFISLNRHSSQTQGMYKIHDGHMWYKVKTINIKNNFNLNFLKAHCLGHLQCCNDACDFYCFNKCRNKTVLEWQHCSQKCLSKLNPWLRRHFTHQGLPCRPLHWLK